MLEILLVVVLGFFSLALLFLKICGLLHIPSLRKIRQFNKLPGPTHYPFYIGVVADIIKLTIPELIPWMNGQREKYGNVVAHYAFGQTLVTLYDSRDVELLLTSNKNIDKGSDYDILIPWLKQGLVMSSGAKWKQRRKMLTPSFHFKILDGNTSCMNRGWKKVAQYFLSTKGAPIEPLHAMGRGALDIICEAAMGTELDKDESGEQYVAAVKRVTIGAIKRELMPLYKNDFIYNMTPSGRELAKDVELLHNFTGKVIRERRKAYDEKKSNEMNDYSDDGKKPQAFLDSILEFSNTMGLTDSDIQEEVDTFMFAGHDTTSTALQFVFLHLGENLDIQEKAYQEQIEIFGYSDRDATKEDLTRMHYLEQVIKESMRLHPPVPQISRKTVEDIKLHDGKIVPAESRVFINIFLIHRMQEYFPDPMKFDPERFTPEASKGRHPYCYLPFSAGPRNCIGQKFALMEMKVAMSIILRTFRIKTLTRSEDLEYGMTVVLQPKPAIRIEFEPRN